MVSLASLEITFDIIMQSSFSCLSLHWEQNKKPRVQMNRLVTNLPRGQSCLLQCFLSVGKIKFLQQNRLPFNLCKSSPGVKGTMHVSLYKRLCLLIPISLHRQCYFNTLNKTKGTIYLLPFELKKREIYLAWWHRLIITVAWLRQENQGFRFCLDNLKNQSKRKGIREMSQ